jgi:hypothetical protein
MNSVEFKRHPPENYSTINPDPDDILIGKDESKTEADLPSLYFGSVKNALLGVGGNSKDFFSPKLLASKVTQLDQIVKHQSSLYKPLSSNHTPSSEIKGKPIVQDPVRKLDLHKSQMTGHLD